MPRHTTGRRADGTVRYMVLRCVLKCGCQFDKDTHVPHFPKQRRCPLAAKLAPDVCDAQSHCDDTTAATNSCTLRIVLHAKASSSPVN